MRRAGRPVWGRGVGVALALGLALLPRLGLGAGTLEVGVTGGPQGFLERAALLRVVPWEVLALDAEAAFANAEDANLTEYYRVGVTLRTPAGVDLGGGYSRSPAANRARSQSCYGELTATFTTVPDRWDWATAVTLAFEVTTLSFQLPTGWADIRQERFDARVAQTLFDRWALSAEYSGYSYDRDLDRAADLLIRAGLRQRSRVLLFLADRVSNLPDRALGIAVDFYPRQDLRLGASFSRIKAAVETLGEDQDRWGAEGEYRFPFGVGVTLGVDRYQEAGEGSSYPYVRCAYDF